MLFYLIPIAWLLASCAPTIKTRSQRIQPQLDPHLYAVHVSEFGLQMTPRAALAVTKAKGYRESSKNRVTLEDLILDPWIHDVAIEVFEFDHGDSLDDRLLKEIGVFKLWFDHGRVYEINYDLTNIHKEKLKAIRQQNEEPFRFATMRETKILEGPRSGSVTSWKYTPNTLAFLRINYIEREPRMRIPQLGEPGIGSCSYSITVFDGNYNIARQRSR